MPYGLMLQVDLAPPASFPSITIPKPPKSCKQVDCIKFCRNWGQIKQWAAPFPPPLLQLQAYSLLC